MANGDNLCMGCMNPLPEGRGECGICGYPASGENPSNYLPVRTLLSDRYLVGRVLHAGGDAAVYIGFDQVLKAAILIREFLPDTLCERAEDGTVQVIGGCENTFAEYKEKFRTHARALARLRDLPAVMPMYDIFEQNNTAYTVSEYCEGVTLEARLQQMGGRMSWEEARPLLMPVMASLAAMHSAGLVHLGLCAENMIIGTDGRLRLTGFAIPEARMVSTDLKPQLIPGYSAPEQYGFELSAGIPADVYGLATTVFRVLTGNPPPDSTSRTRNSSDLYVPADVAKTLPDHVAAALFNALQISPDKRTSSIAAFRDQLTAAPAVTALLQDEAPAQGKSAETNRKAAESTEKTPEPPKKKKNGKYILLVALAVFIVLLLIAGAVLLLLFPDLFGGEKDTSGQTSQTMPTWTMPNEQSTVSYNNVEATYAVENLVGKLYKDVKGTTLRGNMKEVEQYKQYSTRPKGEILDQSPKAEESRPEGTTVYVIISDGPEATPVPDVTGWPELYARRYLELAGFEVTTVKVQESDQPRGNVEGTEPAVGTALEEGAKVTLYISDVAPVTSTPPDTSQNTPGGQESSSRPGRN